MTTDLTAARALADELEMVFTTRDGGLVDGIITTLRQLCAALEATEEQVRVANKLGNALVVVAVEYRWYTPPEPAHPGSKLSNAAEEAIEDWREYRDTWPLPPPCSAQEATDD